MTSPLVALMTEQTEKFREMGLNATSCGIESDASSVLNGQAQLVFITPKSLMSNRKYLKVAVNCKLQKFMHGFSILYLYIEEPTVSFAILYCRASLVLLSQQIS